MNKFKAIFGVLGVMALLFGLVFYFFGKIVGDVNAHKDANAQAYEAHALNDPFNLLSKTYLNGVWKYTYQINSPVIAATKSVETQLSGGGYQVNAQHADTNNMVYRDLITADISVKVAINQTPTGSTAAIVTVTTIGKN